MACGIYYIKNLVNNKVYIGQSICIQKRWLYHNNRLGHNTHHNIHLQGAWNMYKKENFEFKIIVECLAEDLNYLESYWAKFYDSFNPDKGYNQTIILEGGKYKLTEEGRKKIGDAHRGKKMSKKTRKRMSKSAKGKVVTIETRLKMGIAKSGVIFSKETREKMSKSKKKWMKENKERRIKGRLKAIVQMDLEGNTIKEFSCMKEATTTLGLSETWIRYCCKGKKEQTSGFKFKYKNIT